MKWRMATLGLMALMLVGGGRAGWAAHPRFYATSSTEVQALVTKSQDTDDDNIFNMAPKDIAHTLINEADGYLEERAFSALDYTLFFPFLEPFPHDESGKSMHVGTSSSAAAWAKWDLSSNVTGNYLIEFEYRYDSASEQDGFRVFSAYGNGNLGVTILTQDGASISTHDQSSVATLAEDTWYHFAIEVNNTANTYTLYLNGTAVRSNGTLLYSNGTLSTIGYLGDVSTGGYTGQGWWDNFRVSQGHTVVHYDYLDGTLGNWTVYNPVEQATYPDIPHDDRGESAYPYWTSFSRSIEQRLRVVALAYLLTSDTDYSDYCHDVLLSLCGSGWSTWTEPDYTTEIALAESHFCMGASIAYDTIFNTLTSTEKTTIQDGILNRAISPIYTHHLTWFNNSNVCALQLAAEGIGALALNGERRACPHIWARHVTALMISTTSWTLTEDSAREPRMAATPLTARWSSPGSICTSPAPMAWDRPYLSEVGRFCWQVLNPAMSQYIKLCGQPWRCNGVRPGLCLPL